MQSRLGCFGYEGHRFSVVDSGAVTTDAKTDMPLRLQQHT